MLTIPACAAAYGQRAGRFAGLLHVEKRGSTLALVENARSSVKTKGRAEGGGRVMYWLVPSVYQQPDPGVLPTMVAYEQAILAALADKLSAPARGS